MDFTGLLLLWEQGNPVYHNAVWYTADGSRCIGQAAEVDVSALSREHRLETVGEPRTVLGVQPYYFAMVYRVKPLQADNPAIIVSES
jgi:hypothetical protein